MFLEVLVISVASRPRVVGLVAMPVVLLVVVDEGVQKIMTTSVIPRIMTNNVIPRDVRVVVGGIFHDSVIERMTLTVAAPILLLL